MTSTFSKYTVIRRVFLLSPSFFQEYITKSESVREFFPYLTFCTEQVMKWRVADWHFSSLIIIRCSLLTFFGDSVMEVRRSDGESSGVEDDLYLQHNGTAPG